jgi:hypothetical protein
MSKRHHVRVKRWESFVRWLTLSLWVAFLYQNLQNLPTAAGTTEPISTPRNKIPVGRSASAKAALIRRDALDRKWHLVDSHEILSNEELILGLPGSALESANSAVQLSFFGDLNGLGRYRIIETAVQLHRSPGVDLDFTLDRGRVRVVNHRTAGEAQVRLRVRSESWDISLQKPGTSMAFETYARWPRGATFSRVRDPKYVPTASLVMLVLNGEVMLKHNGFEYDMLAPPGPAIVEWDSVLGQDDSPSRLETLPDWAMAGVADTPQAKVKKATLERFHEELLSRPIETVLADFLNSDKEAERRLAVFALAALDDLATLGRAMRESRFRDVLDNGIVALRHWIGREPGQDQILYEKLVTVTGLKPVYAETVMQLLHSFGDNQLARPELYQTLIDYLDHDVLPIRALAHWHLVRLVPAGKSIPYDSRESLEKRAMAIELWRKLVPKGQIPARTLIQEKHS